MFSIEIVLAGIALYLGTITLFLVTGYILTSGLNMIYKLICNNF